MQFTRTKNIRSLGLALLRRPYRWCFGKLIEFNGNLVPIEGERFYVNSPAITHKTRFLFGHYETAEREIIKHFVDPALPVVEFGAAIGVVSCLTNKRLKDPTKHVVVEANTDLIPLLHRNREINGCHFTILHRAVAYEGEHVIFYLNKNFTGSSTHTLTDKSVRVPATNLRKIVDAFGFTMCTLICDIEGGEADLVEFDAETLRERVRTLIMEVHPHLGSGVIKDLLAKLQHAGFNIVFTKLDNYVFSNSAFAQEA
jgi:FkbM family methyltransferase